MAPTPMDFSQIVQMSCSYALQKGGGGAAMAPHPPNRGEYRYAIGCISTNIPNTKLPNFIIQYMLAPQHRHKASKQYIFSFWPSHNDPSFPSLVTMSQNHSSILSPHNSAFPIASVFCSTFGGVFPSNRRRL